MSQRLKVTPHSLKITGKAEPINPEDFASVICDLLDIPLIPQRQTIADKIINVVYVVGTGNKGKIENMDACMRERLEEKQEQFRSWGYIINFLGTFPLDVSSGQPSQPIGPKEGIAGVAGRIRNSHVVVEGVLKKEKQEVAIPEGLQEAIEQADIHIFGGQEASPDLKAKLPFEPNYLGLFFATVSLVKGIQRFIIGKSPGLEVVEEAVLEARRRNDREKREGRFGEWTGGKILVEWGDATSHSDWHKELGPKNTDRFSYSTQGYDVLDLPLAWFEDVIPELGLASPN